MHLQDFNWIIAKDARRASDKENILLLGVASVFLLLGFWLDNYFCLGLGSGCLWYGLKEMFSEEERVP